MDIVDSQIHVWSPNTKERPWAANSVHRPEDDELWTPERVLGDMDQAGIRRAILVPPSWEGERNDLALAAAERLPDRFAVMGRIGVDKPADPARLAGWKRQKGMLGLRFTLIRREARLFLDGAADWAWEAAERHDIPVAVLAPEVLGHVGVIAARHPGLRIAIDHMAMSTGSRDEIAFAHQDELAALARHPNIAVKVSALPCNSSLPYPFANLHPLIRRVYDDFGPERMFWGSDLSRLPCPYRQCVTYFTEELPFLSEADKELIMGRAICRWLDWPL